MRTLHLPSVLTFAALSALAPCQGLIVPQPMPRDQRWQPPLEVCLLQVHASITDGAATTELQQTIANRSAQMQEATWLLPLPPGASADRFTMTVNGKETEGEVLDQHRARQVYEEIVRKRRDPGLLEYLGCGMLRARVFPIPPNGEVLVKVRYTELLPASAGITTWRFPLRSAFADGLGPQKLSLLVELSSQTPIKNVYSPLDGLDIVRDGDRRAKASLEVVRGQMPSRDLSLHYGLGEQDFGLHLLTHQKGSDGFFLMLLSPKRDWPAQSHIVRSINLVLDTSGSMNGEKIEQARGAVRTFLGSLSDKDYFNVIPFSTEARPFFAQPVLANKDNVATALQKVAELAARGGTNIEDALQQALRGATPDCYKGTTGPITMVPITVFLTDGQPTVGTTNVDQLLEQAGKNNAEKARIFVFGVGSDVNTRLLDTLAQQSRGDRDYVLPGENIELKTDGLFQKLTGPVMTDIKLVCDGIDIQDQQPGQLADLFKTSTLTICGRYRGAGHKAIRLSGNVGGQRHEYVFEGDFSADCKQHDWLPTLWAQRKIATLLDAIRLNGQQHELVAEVTRLGKEFGIVTPFTSHLILEEGQQLAQFRGFSGDDFFLGANPAADSARLRAEWGRAGVPAAAGGAVEAKDLDAGARKEAEVAKARLNAPAPQTGAAAVEQSLSVLALSTAGADRGAGDSRMALTHCRIGDHQFFLVGGVWVDAAFTAAMQAKVQKVEAFSDAYFELLRQRPQLAKVLAFSTRIVVVDGDAVFEVQ